MRAVAFVVMVALAGCSDTQNLQALDDATQQLVGKACAELNDCQCAAGDETCRLWKAILADCPQPPSSCGEALAALLNYEGEPAQSAQSGQVSATGMLYGESESTGSRGWLIVAVTNAGSQAHDFTFTPAAGDHFTWTPTTISGPVAGDNQAHYHSFSFTSTRTLTGLAGSFTLHTQGADPAQASMANPYAL